MASSKTVKTRVCIISDTHTRSPFPSEDTQHAYRLPLPSADVLLHAGDLTVAGYISEYETMLEMLKAADAELKIVIAGNHDITLDAEYYGDVIRRRVMHRGIPEDLEQVREMWMGEEARKAGIIYLEEGVKAFQLKNGAQFTLYASPYQPEYCNWAFGYERNQDRYNPAKPVAKFKAPSPVPSWPEIDIMLTHGPPLGILDRAKQGDNVGCEFLLQAVKRCRPRLHCFGHIHEGWGAERYDWSRNTSEPVRTQQALVLENRCAQVNIAQDSERPLKFGDETIFVNGAIMNVNYSPRNAPWVVDLDLPRMEEAELRQPV